jgi:NAD(P)-dependent dehydrogenase (short-subunit alcohol dehydrogenase family)
MNPVSDLRLDGSVIVVTGASSGLGEQFARAVARAGAKTVLVARRADRLERLAAELGDALVVATDLTDAGAADMVVTAAAERFGRIDGLVNNAGITNVTRALDELPEDFRNILEVNLIAPFLLAQAAARSMRESGGGAIVNVSSVVGLQALQPLPEAAYAASKGAMISLTRELATQWARYGIRVNSLAPGGFGTEMTGDVYEPHGSLGGMMATRVPFGRSGRPGELDSMLLVLLHPSSSYTTGQVVAIDGGLTAC